MLELHSSRSLSQSFFSNHCSQSTAGIYPPHGSMTTVNYGYRTTIYFTHICILPHFCLSTACLYCCTCTCSLHCSSSTQMYDIISLFPLINSNYWLWLLLLAVMQIFSLAMHSLSSFGIRGQEVMDTPPHFFHSFLLIMLHPLTVLPKQSL